ncbi:hypothetical protein ATCC90586_002285 [Pythium insidiosum]|nr:hypothetical protein ATCC90586_002285 [Pythium insidiosum]
MLRLQRAVSISPLLRLQARSFPLASARSLAPAPARRAASSSSRAGEEGALQSLWARYSALLVSHPVPTKVATACGIAAIGDINCQLFIERNERFDGKRLFIFTFLGGVLVAPVLHVWYGFMGARIPGLSTPQAVVKRLALDQLVFAPTFLPVFFSTLLTLEGVPEQIPSKLRQDWWSTVKVNWVVWVPAQLINFRFVPGNLQVLFANVVGLFWNSYLSFVSHADADANTDTASGTAPPQAQA